VPGAARGRRFAGPRLPRARTALDQELDSGENGRVSYWEAAPSESARAWVERACFSRDDGPAPFPAVRVVPDGAVDLLFSVAVDGRCQARLFGLKTQALSVQSPEPCENLALRLRPGAAHRLFGVPAAALCDGAPELGALVGGRADALCERIAAARDPGERQRVAERALAEWSRAVRAADADDALLHRIVSEIRRRRGALRIGPLADALGVGARKLERLFRARVGVGPKAYARIVRFFAAYQALAAGAEPLAAALAHGFFDQAHLCRDFRLFAGEAPRRIFPSEAPAHAASLAP
jgi:methylphosphotriester-DNA--protein-cysteine methyltransferase